MNAPTFIMSSYILPFLTMLFKLINFNPKFFAQLIDIQGRNLIKSNSKIR